MTNRTLTNEDTRRLALKEVGEWLDGFYRRHYHMVSNGQGDTRCNELLVLLKEYLVDSLEQGKMPEEGK